MQRPARPPTPVRSARVGAHADAPSPPRPLAHARARAANVAFAFFLMMGSVGFYSSWFFVRYIYSSIKTD